MIEVDKQIVLWRNRMQKKGLSVACLKTEAQRERARLKRERMELSRKGIKHKNFFE